MTYRLLVPLDGTEIENEVAPYLRHILKRPDAVVTLLHVLPDLTSYAQSHIDTQHGRAATHMHEFIEQLQLDPGRVHCEFRMGDPVEEILRYCALNGASLIIMPTHGRSGLDRLLSGSVTEQVMRKVHCPLLLSHACQAHAQTQGEDHLFDRILVPLDGTRQGLTILPVVEDFARLYRSEVILFHDNGGVSDVGDRLEDEGINTLFETLRTRLAGESINVSLQYADAGRPAQDILAAVSGSNADLVAMTTHGRTGIDRMAYGSVVEHVLKHASRPLLVMSTAPGRPTEYVEKYLG